MKNTLCLFFISLDLLYFRLLFFFAYISFFSKIMRFKHFFDFFRTLHSRWTRKSKKILKFWKKVSLSKIYRFKGFLAILQVVPQPKKIFSTWFELSMKNTLFYLVGSLRFQLWAENLLKTYKVLFLSMKIYVININVIKVIGLRILEIKLDFHF